MIARVWRGWTTPEHADAYEKFLQERIFPGLRQIDGYQGGYIMRQNRSDEVEFLVMNLFESLEAVKALPDLNIRSQSLSQKPGSSSPKPSHWHTIMKLRLRLS